MAKSGPKWRGLRSALPVMFNFLLALVLVSAERSFKRRPASSFNETQPTQHHDLLSKALDFLWQSDKSGYEHVWPDMKFGWEIIVGSIIGFCGAAFGSVGGVGGGGIFVPMLSLIIGFDPKSATAISKCMIMGAAASTVYYNLKLRHPTLDLPIIDYDLALLIQPMLMLGISMGVSFNVIFADWMVTVLLIVLFLGTSVKAFMKGIETWKKETILEKEAQQLMESNGVSYSSFHQNTQGYLLTISSYNFPSGSIDADYKLLPSGCDDVVNDKETKEPEVSVLENVCWVEFVLLVFVWIAFLALQITKSHVTSCSWSYWILELLQIPVSVGVSFYEAISLYKGRRVISSKGKNGSNLQVYQLLLYCSFGILAGVVGGLLGLGGGFILGPLFLELGIPPPVSSATATFAMTFSSSMSVVENYLLKRFPVPYALYFVGVATVAASMGQHLVRKLIITLGRASLIIFILSLTIFISAISLGGVGISRIIYNIQENAYMGFENLCRYGVH